MADRYHGNEDPLAKKIIQKHFDAKIKPPHDKSITTLQLTDLIDTIEEDDIK